MNAWIEATCALPRGVHVVTSLRRGLGTSEAPFDQLNLGLHSGDDVEVVQRNRRDLAAALQLPSMPHWLSQVHGTNVLRFKTAAANNSIEPTADASVTSENAVVLSILTADCLPVALVAKDGKEIALAHAGWRGLAAGVLERTVEAMSTPSENLMAWMGPAAGPCIYEVGEEVRDVFLSEDANASKFFRDTQPGHWHVDLYGLARKRLQSVGVREVHGGDRCTISEPEAFFSHRRDARTGRIATLAWMD